MLGLSCTPYLLHQDIKGDSKPPLKINPDLKCGNESPSAFKKKNDSNLLTNLYILSEKTLKGRGQLAEVRPEAYTGQSGSHGEGLVCEEGKGWCKEESTRLFLEAQLPVLHNHDPRST